MRRNTVWYSLLIAASFLSTNVQAKAPEDVVHEYVAAIQAEGMPAIARFIHPDDLERFKQMFMPLVRSEKLFDKQTFREFLFDAETSVVKIEAMSGTEFMNAFMTRVGKLMPAFKIGPMKVVGSVPEGELIHVIARGSAEVLDIKVNQLEVISLKPYQGGWRLLLDAKMEGMAAAFEKAMK